MRHRVLDCSSDNLLGYTQRCYTGGTGGGLDRVRLKSAINAVKSKLRNKQYPFINAAEEEVESVIASLPFCRDDFNHFIVFGAGGSILGGKCLLSLVQSKVIFCDTLDVRKLASFFQSINLKKSYFIFISKSGTTIEVLAQYRLTKDLLKDINFKDQCMFITAESDTNELLRIASKDSIKVLTHPQDVGGRFSYLTIVGLLPAYCAELDLKQILEGALNRVKVFVKNEDDPIIEYTSLLCNAHQQGAAVNIMIAYDEMFTQLGMWFEQLWSESLGKHGFGSIPITDIGLNYHHSKLQLYLDGPKNKVFTFIKPKANNEVIYSYYNVALQQLKDRSMLTRVVDFEVMNEYTLSAFMTGLIIELLVTAEFFNIDPFTQDSVVKCKQLALANFHHFK